MKLKCNKILIFISIILLSECSEHVINARESLFLHTAYPGPYNNNDVSLMVTPTKLGLQNRTILSVVYSGLPTPQYGFRSP